jgi:DNA-binding phage protein
MILKKQKKSLGSMSKKLKLKEDAKVFKHDPLKELMDEEKIAKAIWECLKNNDPEGVLEVIAIHLNAVNKSKSLEIHKLPRSTMYSAFKGKNPTVRTLAKMVNCIERSDCRERACTL